MLQSSVKLGSIRLLWYGIYVICPLFLYITKIPYSIAHQWSSVLHLGKNCFTTTLYTLTRYSELRRQWLVWVVIAVMSHDKNSIRRLGVSLQRSQPVKGLAEFFAEARTWASCIRTTHAGSRRRSHRGRKLEEQTRECHSSISQYPSSRSRRRTSLPLQCRYYPDFQAQDRGQPLLWISQHPDAIG